MTKPVYSNFTINSNRSAASDPKLPTMRGDPVNILWCVPITAAERAFAEEHSSAELWARLQAAGHGVLLEHCDGGTIQMPQPLRAPHAGRAGAEDEDARNGTFRHSPA